MKNVINYYYDIYIDNIYQVNGIYYFTYINDKYMLKPFFRDIKDISSLFILNQEIIRKNNYYHKIILNKDNSCYTVIDNKVYVLIKITNIINDKISIYDLNYIKIDIKKEYGNIIFSNWYDLWIKKIDYLEYELNSKDIDNNLKIIYHFFIGLSENAVSLYKSTIDRYGIINNLYIQHRRINYNYNLIDYYDPLELVIDNKVRDLGELVKSLIMNNKFDHNTFSEYLDYLKLDIKDLQLLLSRILFPTLFYDNLNNLEFIYSIDIDKYISYLKDIYEIIKSKNNIEEINWLKK